MATPGEERIPTELVERWVKFLKPSLGASFRHACLEANMHTIGSALQPFFATWRTSLMRSSLDKLKSMSMEDHLCAMLENIVIEDDSEILDPYCSLTLPSATTSYEIWPRNDAGVVNLNDIGIGDLMTMLLEKRLRPKTIKIRDYHIAECNLDLCPEMICVRDQFKKSPTNTQCHGAIGAMARDLIEGADLTIKSLVIRSAEPPSTENSVTRSPRFAQPNTTWILGSPTIREAIVGLSIERLGQGLGFSILHSAVLSLGYEATSYWLEKVLYSAPTLQSLTLSIASPWITSLDTARVAPRLNDFELSSTTISAEAIIAMLACSRETLTCIRLRQVTLERESTWQELLGLIATEYTMLNCFSLVFLREVRSGSLAIDFRELRKGDFPEICRSGLDLVEMGPIGNRRVTKMHYSGPTANSVLGIVCKHGRKGIPN